MKHAARCALTIALLAACAVACHLAVAQERGSEQQATATSTQKAPGTLEILLGRNGRQQARGGAVANSNVSTVPAALRADQQPIAMGTPEATARGNPNKAARNAPAATPLTSAPGSAGADAPTRANSLGRDTPATNVGPADSDSSDVTPAPQK